MSHQQFMMILQLAADSPDRLRSSEEDVLRVLEEANQQHCFEEFKAWLLQQDLRPKTRELVESAHEIITLFE